ncbi:MAG: hypothetical protein IKB87_04875 [Clostridia bacterium]|nr:hypothetical protein [Clostridia bacterium]
MIARTGIIDNYDREKKRVTLIWDDTKNRSLPLLMLKGLADNTEITNQSLGKTETPVKLPDACECGGIGTYIEEGNPGVPIIGCRALAVLLDRSGHGVYIGMIQE